MQLGLGAKELAADVHLRLQRQGLGQFQRRGGAGLGLGGQLQGRLAAQLHAGAELGLLGAVAQAA